MLAVFILVGFQPAQAQQRAKVARIGYLSALDPAIEAPRAEIIRLGLRERGYIDGQNIAIEYRYTNGKVDGTAEFIAELVRLKVDVIVVAGGDPWVRAAKSATKTVPLVMVGGGSDPVEAGFIESLAHPGGNLTGVTLLAGELGGKRLDLLKEAVPKLARVAVLNDPTSPANVIELKNALPPAARALKLTIQSWEARTADDLDKVFAAPNKQRPDGIYVLQGPLMNTNQKQIAGLAIKRRLPSISVRRNFVDAGGLMSYGADLTESYKRVAYYVDRILKDAKPADLPVERPMKFELAFNLKTAAQIGITIPQSVLYRGDKVVR